MKISDILSSGKKVFPSLEIVPPLKGISKKELIDNIRPFMEFNPPYINVTSHRDEVEYEKNADGSFSRRLVRRRVSETAVCSAIQAEFKTDVVPHVICGGHDRTGIDNLLQDFKFLGIDNVMALRGDCLVGEKRFAPDTDGYNYASELVSGIREFGQEHQADFCIGVGAYPEKHFEAANLESDIVNLKKKVDAGADFIITQMFFDNASFYHFENKCRQAGITVPIIPGLKPLSSYKQVTMLPEAFSIDIPLELTSELEKYKEDKQKCYEIGQLWCQSQCSDLIAHGVPAVHFYTMGKAGNVIGILRKCF